MRPEAQTSGGKESQDGIPRGSRRLLSRGLTTAIVATLALFAASALFASTSLSRGVLLTMLPFAAALAIASLGQTLVVMQGGIDLSIAGGLSLYVVILTHYPNGDNGRLLPAIAIAFVAAIAAGSLNGFLIGRTLLNPIVATLGTNALLYGAVFWYTGGIPRTTTARLASLGGGVLLGIPTPVYFAVAATAVVTAVVKLTAAGRRFEGVGANATAALTAGIRVKRHRTGAYVWAQLLYCLAAVLHAGIVNQPTAHEGDNYLLPSVAAVVLGGTSLLGGRGNLIATAIAALFLSQLDQFVLALGVTYATRTLVQAGALAVGVALYTVNWQGLVRRLRVRRPTSIAPT
ncbi:MAG: ribose transport system permease protein [Gaiellales bacterium]|nr:ribose transport system permease protein [Gaiellales bacterium]